MTLIYVEDIQRDDEGRLHGYSTGINIVREALETMFGEQVTEDLMLQVKEGTDVHFERHYYQFIVNFDCEKGGSCKLHLHEKTNDSFDSNVVLTER